MFKGLNSVGKVQTAVIMVTIDYRPEATVASLQNSNSITAPFLLCSSSHIKPLLNTVISLITFAAHSTHTSYGCKLIRFALRFR